MPSEWSNVLSPTTWAMLQGQWISLLIAGTGVFASMLSDSNANFPLLMSLGNYGLLSIFLIRYYFRQKTPHEEQGIVIKVDLLEDDDTNKSSETNHIQVSKWIYLVAAILDVEANFLVIEAYNYTSITSVMLLDCFTIPCAMALSYFFLGCRYKWKHGIGTVLCLAGLICIVINDVLNVGDDDGHSNALMGDILCLSGAILYATSNVMQETLVKFHDRDQYLGCMGGFGVIIAFIQFMIIDFPQVQETTFTLHIVGSMIGFVMCLFFMYISTSSYLQASDAILFNLSLLTSDVYAVIFTYFFYGYLVDWLYFIAFALVIVGLMLYHSEKPPIQVGQDNQTEAYYPLCLHRFTNCMQFCSTQAKSFIPINTDESNCGDGEENDAQGRNALDRSLNHHSHLGNRSYQQPPHDPRRYEYNPIATNAEDS